MEGTEERGDQPAHNPDGPGNDEFDIDLEKGFAVLDGARFELSWPKSWEKDKAADASRKKLTVKVAIPPSKKSWAKKSAKFDLNLQVGTGDEFTLQVDVSLQPTHRPRKLGQNIQGT